MRTKSAIILLIFGLLLSGCLDQKTTTKKEVEGMSSQTQNRITTTTIPDEDLNLDEVDFGFIGEEDEVEIGTMI